MLVLTVSWPEFTNLWRAQTVGRYAHQTRATSTPPTGQGSVHPYVHVGNNTSNHEHYCGRLKARTHNGVGPSRFVGVACCGHPALSKRRVQETRRKRSPKGHDALRLAPPPSHIGERAYACTHILKKYISHTWHRVTDGTHSRTKSITLP